MATRAEIDAALSRHPAVGSEPRDGIYRYIHRDRLRLRGYRMEARVTLKALTRTDKPRPFLIYASPRSGSTLLVRLLNQLPGLRCEGELLQAAVLSPRRMLRNLPRRAGANCDTYGLKLLSYQLMEVHRVHRPLAFFDALGGAGYRFVHLRRDTFEQTLSLAKAHAGKGYFASASTDTREVRVDPERFLALLGWNARMLAYETAVMANLPHLALDYDSDLKQADRHQDCVDRVCDFLGASADGPQVAATTRRTGGTAGVVRLLNAEEIRDAVRSSDLAHLLP